MKQAAPARWRQGLRELAPEATLGLVVLLLSSIQYASILPVEPATSSKLHPMGASTLLIPALILLAIALVMVASAWMRNRQWLTCEGASQPIFSALTRPKRFVGYWIAFAAFVFAVPAVYLHELTRLGTLPAPTSVIVGLFLVLGTVALTAYLCAFTLLYLNDVARPANADTRLEPDSVP